MCSQSPIFSRPSRCSPFLFDTICSTATFAKSGQPISLPWFYPGSFRYSSTLAISLHRCVIVPSFIYFRICLPSFRSSLTPRHYSTLLSHHRSFFLEILNVCPADELVVCTSICRHQSGPPFSSLHHAIPASIRPRPLFCNPGGFIQRATAIAHS